MTIPFWCVLIILFLPYTLVPISAKYRIEQFGCYDNNHPRDQWNQLTGRGARVWAAHQNALEARVNFTAGVLVAYLAEADPEYSAIAAIVFVACRILHAYFYINDWAGLRTTAFGISMACVLSLFVLAGVA